MADNKDKLSRKVIGVHESIKSGIRTGHCPCCRTVMSYRGSNVTQCLCCGLSVEWGDTDN